MPQRKPPTVPTKKPPAKASGRAGAPPSARPGAARKPGTPPGRRPNKSIVNQRQTPWALIATVVVLVLFAGGIVAYAVTRNHDSGSTNPYTRPEVAAAKKIPGIVWHVEPKHNHTTGLVKYDMSPPIGGNHSPYWALCNGVVYNHQIANENAVHMLEHGSVWITYNPKTIKPGDLAKLKTDVLGVDRMALSPYAGLKTPISLQAWNYQLFVQRANDPRINQFIEALRYKPNTVTPEPNAGCTGDGFVASQSYPGHPYDG